MSESYDGGPAFPINGWEGPNDIRIWPEPGMTLRDYFAGQQLHRIGMGWPNEDNMKRIAENCYAMADAMLAARTALEKNNG